MTAYALAVDTSTRRVSVAVGTEAGVIAQTSAGGAGAVGPPRHVEQLAPAIEYVMDAASLSLRELSVVATCIGPGMFTGLRVGIVTATMLADALEVPCVGATSLELIADPIVERLALDSDAVVIPVMDARRAEVYYGAFSSDGSQLVAASIATPDAVVVALAALAQRASMMVFVGDGALRFREELSLVPGAEFASHSDASPDIVALLGRGVRGFLAGRGVGPDEIAPLYLRHSDAEINKNVVAGGRQ